MIHLIYTNYQAFFQTLSQSQRFFSQAASALLMWPVPVFVMVSGALLLDPSREIPLTKIFRKYIFRMGMVLLVFGMAFRFYDAIMNNEPMGLSVIVSGLENILTGNSWAHMWYIYLLIGLYLILPVLRRFVQSATDKEIRYFLVLNIIFFGLTQLLQVVQFPLGFYIHFSTIYPAYFIMGYALHNGIISIKKEQALALLGITSLCIVALTWTHISRGTDLSALWGYPSALVFLQATGMFSFFSYREEKKSILGKLDPYTFGIYLIHLVFVRYALFQMGINPYNGFSLMNFIGMIAVITALSFAATWIMKRIPGLKQLL